MKILVRATNWVGDAVMSIPALEAVRSRWPEAEITVTGRAGIVPLYRGQNFADRVCELSATEVLRRERFDLGVLLPNSFASAWLMWRTGARERVGYARDGRGWLLTRAIRQPRPGQTPPHEAYYYLELLRRAGWIDALPKAACARLKIASEDAVKAEENLRRLDAGHPRVALGPGASYGAAKCWLAERYAAVADRLAEQFGASIVLVGTPAEREIGRRIAAAMRRPPIDLIGKTAIAELPAQLGACDLFLGNDSGAMHVAASVGLPVAAVFGSTDPEGTSPLTERQIIVRRPVSCSPCFLRYCPVDHRCMTRVSVDDVFQAAAQWMPRKRADE